MSASHNGTNGERQLPPWPYRVMRVAMAVLLIVVGFWLIATSLATVITPPEMTQTAIGESFYRIYLYANANQKLPETLDDLPNRSGYGNRITDGWGNRLNYEISDDGIITLSSLGADQKPGGIGDDADISRSYRSVDEQGVFIAGQEMWIVTGELHPSVEAE